MPLLDVVSPVPLTNTGNWEHTCKGQFSKQSCAQGTLLLIWCSTIVPVLLKEKLNVLPQVVMGDLRPPSGLQWTRNELEQQFGLWLTLIVTSHWEYSV